MYRSICKSENIMQQRSSFRRMALPVEFTLSYYDNGDAWNGEACWTGIFTTEENGTLKLTQENLKLKQGDYSEMCRWKDSISHRQCDLAGDKGTGGIFPVGNQVKRENYTEWLGRSGGIFHDRREPKAIKKDG